MKVVKVDGWSFRPGDMLTPAQVAHAFDVDAKTVTRWAGEGRLTWIRTPGGHRRYSSEQIDYLKGGGAPGGGPSERAEAAGPKPGETWVTPDDRPWFVIETDPDVITGGDVMVVDLHGDWHLPDEVEAQCGRLSLAYRPRRAGPGERTGGR